MITPNSSDTDLRATLPPVGDDDMTGGATRAARKFPEGVPTLSKFNGLPAAGSGFPRILQRYCRVGQQSPLLRDKQLLLAQA